MEPQIEKASALLQQKQRLFVSYEQVTDQMLAGSDNDIIENYITKRGELANEIDALDASIAAELAPWEAFRRGLLGGTMEAKALPEPLRPLRPVCQEILAVVRRVRMKNEDLLAGYERQREESLQNIKKGSALPKINRYLTNLSGGEKGNNFGNV